MTSMNRIHLYKKIIPLLLILPWSDAASQSLPAQPLRYSADRLVRRVQGKEVQMLLQGNARVLHGNSQIRAASILIRGEKGDIAEARGKVRFLDPRNGVYLEAGKLIYTRATTTLRASEKPRLVHTTRDKKQVVVTAEILERNTTTRESIARNSVHVTGNKMDLRCRELQYNEFNSEFNLTGEIVAFSEANYAKADTAQYRQKDEILTLEKNVEIMISNKEGNTIVYAPRAVYQKKQDSREDIISVYHTPAIRPRLYQGSLELEFDEGTVIGEKRDTMKAFGNIQFRDTKEGYTGSSASLDLDRAAGLLVLHAGSSNRANIVYASEQGPVSMEGERILRQLTDGSSIVTGNTEMNWSDDGVDVRVRAQKAVMIPENPIEFTGSPSIQRGESILRSRKIKAWPRERRAEVTGNLSGKLITSP